MSVCAKQLLLESWLVFIVRANYKVCGQMKLERSFEDWEPGCIISCNNGNCNEVQLIFYFKMIRHRDAQTRTGVDVSLILLNLQHWGFEIKYKKVALLPNLAIKNFAVDTPDGRRTVKKWKDIPFMVEEFSFEKYCEDNFPNLLD